MYKSFSKFFPFKDDEKLCMLIEAMFIFQCPQLSISGSPALCKCFLSYHNYQLTFEIINQAKVTIQIEVKAVLILSEKYSMLGVDTHHSRLRELNTTPENDNRISFYCFFHSSG